MILLRALGMLWALPLTLVGLLVAVLVDRAHSWRWQDGALTAIASRRRDGTTRIIGRPGGQTIGCVTVYASEEKRADPRLRAHEGRHVLQGLVLGVLWALSYGLHLAWLLVFTPSSPAGLTRFWRSYWWVWAERDARAAERVPKEPA